MTVVVQGERKFPDGTVACTYVASGINALAVSLARLAFPGPLDSLREQLHSSWSVSKMSSIINATVHHLDRTFGNRILYDERLLQNVQ